MRASEAEVRTILGDIGEEGGDVIGAALNFPAAMDSGRYADGIGEIALTAGDAAHGEEGGVPKAIREAPHMAAKKHRARAKPAVDLHDDVRFQAIIAST